MRYDAIRTGIAGVPTVAAVIRALGGRPEPGAEAHLDPDLDRSSLDRAPGWRPSLGQVAQSLSHLRAQGVSPGDLFLFFGRFRQTELEAGRLRYRPGAPELHLIFGWLQVGAVLDFHHWVPEWMRNHPHTKICIRPNWGFVAADRLAISGEQLHREGAGMLGIDQPGAHDPRWRASSTEPVDAAGLVQAVPGTAAPDAQLRPEPLGSRWSRESPPNRSGKGGRVWYFDTRRYPAGPVRHWLRGLFEL